MLAGVHFEACSIADDKFRALQRGTMYAGLLMPFTGHEYMKKKKPVTAVSHILVESLKQSNEVSKFVKDSLSLLPEMNRLYTEFASVSSLEDDAKYALARGLITIGPYYQAVTLLDIANRAAVESLKVEYIDLAAL